MHLHCVLWISNLLVIAGIPTNIYARTYTPLTSSGTVDLAIFSGGIFDRTGGAAFVDAAFPANPAIISIRARLPTR